MSEENNYGVPVLDDIEYTAPAPKKGGPTGVSAPVLDDMGDYVPPAAQKKGAPTGVSAPVLDDDTAPYQAQKKEVLIMTDEEIIAKFTPDQMATYENLPEQNKQKVLDLMRKQLGAEAPPVEVTAPVLDEDNYTPPPKEEKKEEPQVPEESIKAPVLDEAPEPPSYKPQYVDEDLERAKREAAKKAVAAQLVPNQKDSKESLRMMIELKEEHRREMAQKGFKMCIILGILGLVAAVVFYLLYSGSLGLAYKEDLGGLQKILVNTSIYLAIAMAISGFTLMTGVGFCKSLTSFIYIVSGILQIFPGCAMILQHEGSRVLAFALYLVSIALTIFMIFSISANEAIGLFYNKKYRE